jgi:hypothetical protein
MFMLYTAMHDYLKGEEVLVQALDTVIGYIFARVPNQPDFPVFLFFSIFRYHGICNDLYKGSKVSGIPPL